MNAYDRIDVKALLEDNLSQVEGTMRDMLGTNWGPGSLAKYEELETLALWLQVQLYDQD